MVPASFALVVAAFTGCCTAPTYRGFCHLVAGWLRCAGRHTVTGVAVAAGAGVVGWRHISAFHRFFARAAWQPAALGKVVFTLALRVLPAGCPLLLLVDDSLARKEGEAIALGSMHHDPLRSTARRPFSRFGHVWVVLAIWLPLPFGVVGGPRGVALPLAPGVPALRRQQAGQPHGCALARHVRGAVRAGAGRLSRRPGAAPHQARTGAGGDRAGGRVGGRAGAGADRVRRGRHGLREPHDGRGPAPQRRGAGPHAPGCGAVRPAAAAPAGADGAPPAAGRAPPHAGRPRPGAPPRHLARAPRRPLRPHGDAPRVPRHRPVVPRAARGAPALRRGARPQWPAPGCGVLLHGSDRERRLPAGDLRHTLATRWTLEVTFWRLKGLLGFEEPQNQTVLAVRRTAPVAGLVFALVVLWYAAEVQAGRGATGVVRPWYRRKAAPSFADVLATVRYAGLASATSGYRALGFWRPPCPPGRHTNAPLPRHAIRCARA